MDAEHDLIETIAERLQTAQIPYETDATIGGLRPDFIINAPDGRVIVVEVKSWEKSEGFTNRAAHQARLYQDAIGADRAFIVVEDLKRSRVSKGVVTADRLVAALRKEFAQRQVPANRKIGLHPGQERTIFAAMPFNPEYDDVYFVAMAYAANSVDAVCKRVDQEEFCGDIVERIKSMILDSVAVIVDLSGGKSNVLYEAGYAHALEKPTVHICSTPTDQLPFDVSHWNTIQYTMGQTYHLRDKLAKRLRSVLP
jgi:hypothetical protein